jgi:hypothetical protein
MDRIATRSSGRFATRWVGKVDHGPSLPIPIVGAINAMGWMLAALDRLAPVGSAAANNLPLERLRAFMSCSSATWY